MTTYTFTPKISTQEVAWNDPSVWVGGVVPNSPDADVIFPTVTTNTGAIYYSFVSIGSGESFSVNSVNLSGDYLEINGGALSVTNDFNNLTGEIDLNGGSLSAGSLENNGFDTQGFGQVTVAGTVTNNTSIVGNGLTLTAGALNNAGKLIAASGNLTIQVGSGGFTNLSGSTLTGGTYAAGFVRNTSPNILDLNVGGLIATDAANIELDGGGEIASFNSNSGQYVPLQSSLQTIAPSGTLSLADQTYNWGSLTVNGTLLLSDSAILNAPQLTVGSNGVISGDGTIVSPIANAGIIIAGRTSSPPIFSLDTDALIVAGAVTGSGTIEIASQVRTLAGTVLKATLELNGSTSQNIAFLDSTGTLILDNPVSFTGAVAPQAGDNIILPGISINSVTGYSYSGNAQSGTLTIQEAGNTIALAFSGNFGTGNFKFSAGPQPLSSSPPSLEITVGNIITPPPPMTPAGTTADLILQDTAGVHTGQLDVFNLGNNGILAADVLGNVGLSWQALGFGAFAGNPNEADLIMRDGNTGNLEYFDIQSSQIVAAGSMGSIGVNWQVIGFGDISGNANETDMILRDSNTGNLDYFDIQHNQIVGAGSLGNIGTNWQVLGLGDFSGNPGESDMIMRDSNTGNLDYFDIQHNQVVGAGSMGNIGMNWQILGVGGFSGNANETDMIMRDSNTGNLDYFDIQHNQVVGAGSLGNIGLNWQIIGFGDVSSIPGEIDMIMRDGNTGNFDCFDIQHNQIVGVASLGNVGAEWHNLGVGSPLVLGSPLV